eukprot:363683-Chlamydomonas_euryale.AAC.11
MGWPAMLLACPPPFTCLLPRYASFAFLSPTGEWCGNVAAVQAPGAAHGHISSTLNPEPPTPTHPAPPLGAVWHRVPRRVVRQRCRRQAPGAAHGHVQQRAHGTDGGHGGGHLQSDVPPAHRAALHLQLAAHPRGGAVAGQAHDCDGADDRWRRRGDRRCGEGVWDGGTARRGR